MTPERALHPLRELPTLDEITELIDLESMRDDNGGHRDATYTIPPAPVRVRRLCRGLSFSSNSHHGDLSCKRNKKTSHCVSARGENGEWSHRPPAQVLLGTMRLSAYSGFRIGLLSAPSQNRFRWCIRGFRTRLQLRGSDGLTPSSAERLICRC